jgi:hypothetical protein
MLFYLFYAIGFTLLSLMLLVTGVCYFFLIQSMLKKSKRADLKSKNTSQSKLLKFTQKPTTKNTEKMFCVGSM